MPSSEGVRSAEPPVRSRVTSDSLRSVESSGLNPYALVYRPLASDVIHETGTPDESDAADTVCASQDEVTLIDVSKSNSVNVPTPP